MAEANTVRPSGKTIEKAASFTTWLWISLGALLTGALFLHVWYLLFAAFIPLGYLGVKDSKAYKPTYLKIYVGASGAALVIAALSLLVIPWILIFTILHPPLFFALICSLPVLAFIVFALFKSVSKAWGIVQDLGSNRADERNPLLP